MKKPKPGVYQHYKGGWYIVSPVLVTDKNHDIEVVLYQSYPVVEGTEMHTRSYGNFWGMAQTPKGPVARFTWHQDVGQK